MTRRSPRLSAPAATRLALGGQGLLFVDSILLILAPGGARPPVALSSTLAALSGVALLAALLTPAEPARRRKERHDAL